MTANKLLYVIFARALTAFEMREGVDAMPSNEGIPPFSQTSSLNYKKDRHVFIRN